MKRLLQDGLNRHVPIPTTSVRIHSQGRSHLRRRYPAHYRTPRLDRGPLRQTRAIHSGFALFLALVVPAAAAPVLWLDAAALTGLADGETVSTWPDRSGHGNDAVSSGAPTFQSGELNGLPVVRFDGIDDLVTVPHSDSLNVAGHTFFFVVKCLNAVNDNGFILAKHEGTWPTYHFALRYGIDYRNGVAYNIAIGSEGQNSEAGSEDYRNRFAIGAGRLDATLVGTNLPGTDCPAITLFFNGVVDQPSYDAYDATTDDDLFNTYEVVIGKDPRNSPTEPRWFNGDMAELILFDYAMSDQEIADVNAYLGDKWGIPAVPVEPSSKALVFLIAGQSNAGGVAPFSPESNAASPYADYPTTPGSTAAEVGIPLTQEAYPRSDFWKSSSWIDLIPGTGEYGTGYTQDPNRHGIELPMAMLLERKHPKLDKFFVKWGPAGHNLYSQWAANSGPDYVTFMIYYNAAMQDLTARYDEVRVVGLYWDQGESDKPEAAAYRQNLLNLFGALRTDTGIPDLPIFVRKHLFMYGDTEFAPIINAQIEVTNGDPNAYLLDMDLGSNEANFQAWAWTYGNGHLSSRAYLELSGRIMAIIEPAAFGTLYYGK